MTIIVDKKFYPIYEICRYGSICRNDIIQHAYEQHISLYFVAPTYKLKFHLPGDDYQVYSHEFTGYLRIYHSELRACLGSHPYFKPGKIIEEKSGKILTLTEEGSIPSLDISEKIYVSHEGRIWIEKNLLPQLQIANQNSFDLSSYPSHIQNLVTTIFETYDFCWRDKSRENKMKKNAVIEHIQEKHKFNKTNAGYIDALVRPEDIKKGGISSKKVT